MLKFLRYTLAAIFLAASVGCLALWWRSATIRDYIVGPVHVLSNTGGVGAESYHGLASITIDTQNPPPSSPVWRYMSDAPADLYRMEFFLRVDSKGVFGFSPDRGFNTVHFPIWYPALVFALAGVGALRIGQRFTIRSALIATTVVAALLGMVVAL